MIQASINTVTATGGSRSTWVTYWSGWARIDEKAYSTTLEQSQWTGNHTINIAIKKYPVTDMINTTMRVLYRNELYLINSKVELDRFTLQFTASKKQRDE